jgi:HlyD family secretion protein
MKIYKTLLAILVLGTVVATLSGCGSNSDEETSKTQIATAKRGNLTLEITAAGNLALSTIEDLTFDLFYAKGTVGEVNVAAGDTVTEGEILASLDTTEWNDQIQVLEDALTTAQRNVTTKERALATAQRQVTAKEQALTEAERQVTAKELALRQAQIDVETAQYNLDSIEEVKEQQDIIDNIDYQLQFIGTKITESLSPGADPRDWQFWTNEKTRVTNLRTAAQQELNDILADRSINITANVAIEVKRKQLAIETAQMNLDTASKAVADLEITVNNAQQDLTFAQMDVADAQTDLDNANQKAADAQDSLDEARAASPEIVAPFDGFITKVNVAGGDEVLKGTVVAQVADPNKFEADILVSEMDIPNVKLGGEATITSDAISGIIMTANVTHIAPTATIQSGVVNYNVRVEVQSIRPAFTSQNATLSATTNNTTTQLPSRLQAAVDAGRMTQQQAEDFIKNGLPEGFTAGQGFASSGNFTPPEGFTFPAISNSQAKSQITTLANTDFQLRQGMTVTVNVIVASRTNVMLVPNGAVTTEGTQSYVQVISASGVPEKRAVKTGLSDWQYTEITDGLKEGEQVSVTLNTASATTTQRQGNMMFFGGR